MWYDHATESKYEKKVKVAITDYSPPKYVMPVRETLNNSFSSTSAENI